MVAIFPHPVLFEGPKATSRYTHLVAHIYLFASLDTAQNNLPNDTNDKNVIWFTNEPSCIVIWLTVFFLLFMSVFTDQNKIKKGVISCWFFLKVAFSNFLT